MPDLCNPNPFSKSIHNWDTKNPFLITSFCGNDARLKWTNLYTERTDGITIPLDPLLEEGKMQKDQIVRLKRTQGGETPILHLSLQGLLPEGQMLALNLQVRTLSLLSNSPQIIREQRFSENEMRLIVPILELYPHYCPYEMLLAYLSSKAVTQATVERCLQRLQEARARGTWQQELKPIRRALSSLRSKLHAFNLEISNIRERGCSLTSLAPSSFSEQP